MIVRFSNNHHILNFVKLVIDHVLEVLIVSALGLDLGNLELFGRDGAHDLVSLDAEESCVDLACTVLEFCGQIVVEGRVLDGLIAVCAFKLVG